MERDRLNPKRYQYLSQEHSDLYDKAMTNRLTKEEAEKAVIDLIEAFVAATRTAHGASTY